MNEYSSCDPYCGNILTQHLGPILSREESLKKLTSLPPLPQHDIARVPRHIRMHQLLFVRDLHIPSIEGARLQESIDLMLRQSYRYRQPTDSETWRVICNEPNMHKMIRAPAMAAVAVGHSGTGKTEAVLRACSIYPQQVITHAHFPKIAGVHHQVVWLSIDVPASGKLVDLAANLMTAWDMVMEPHRASGHGGRFELTLSKERRYRNNGQMMFHEWRQVAKGHFLGLLHLDEVQNFFKLPSLEKRRLKAGNTESLELKIIEDQCLKEILTLTNTSQMPILCSGTPDGVRALMNRFANIQRITSNGFHQFNTFQSEEDKSLKIFIQQLGRYQFVAKPLTLTFDNTGDEANRRMTNDLVELIMTRTAGIRRLIIALWVAAHKVAFERKNDDSLILEDFQRAADTYLAPVAPAVVALQSKNPKILARYEDLIRQDEYFWNGYWASMANT